jgi:hypothetical protein
MLRERLTSFLLRLLKLSCGLAQERMDKTHDMVRGQITISLTVGDGMGWENSVHSPENIVDADNKQCKAEDMRSFRSMMI